jgi:NitT/TauT family transport system substrate-binding protein
MAALPVRSAFAADKVLYLFPTLPIFPAFAPFHVAKAKGFFSAENLDVTFQGAHGGVDAAKQIGVANGDLAGGLGDTAIILRPNGIPIRGVALLGGRPLHQLIVRKDANIRGFADLKGRKIGVVSFQDTSYYNLLAVLASVGLTKTSVDIQAVGPAGVVQLMANGTFGAIVGAPEWAMNVESKGVGVDIFQIDKVFPAMAQALIASDKTIAERPDLVRRFVSAILKAVKAVEADPEDAAATYLKEIGHPDSERPFITRILTFYAQKVYPTAQGRILGQFDRDHMARVQEFYVKNGIVQTPAPVDQLFTNQFVSA